MYPSNRPCHAFTSPVDTNVSVADGFIPFILPNSKFCPFNTHIKPSVSISASVVLLKNNLYCVLSGITIDSNMSESFMFLSISGCTARLIVPISTSPILAVPATVRNPSGPKNIKSPANSCIVSPFTHPISLVTGDIAKSLAKKFAENNYDLILTARNIDQLRTQSTDLKVRYSIDIDRIISTSCRKIRIK